MGRTYGDSIIFRELIDEGPLTKSEIGTTGSIPIRTRLRYDIRKFDITVKTGGSNTSTGRTLNVYYLHGYHDPEDVLRKWFEVNWDVLRKKNQLNRRQLNAALSGEFHEAWKSIRDETQFEWLIKYEMRSGEGHYANKTCPFCGTNSIRLPDHLPTCTET